MLPPDDMLISDLNTPKWSITTGVPPKIKVQEKDSVVEALGRSPDRGDAVAAALWAEQLRRDGEIAVPQGRIPARSISPLGQRAGTVPGRAGGRSGLGPLG